MNSGNREIMDKKLQEELERIYRDEQSWFDASDAPWARPLALSGEPGFAILYTPPVISPPVLVCGQNPGNFGGSWDSDLNRTMLDGSIPQEHTYRDYPYPLAVFLRDQFDQHCPGLLDRCVGMNVWHCQAEGTPNLDEDQKKFFKKQTIKVIRLLKPKSILAIGVPAFEAIAKKETRGSYLTHEYGGRYFGKGSFGPIPVWLLGHPTGGRTPDKLIAEAASRILSEIKEEMEVICKENDS